MTEQEADKLLEVTHESMQKFLADHDVLINVLKSICVYNNCKRHSGLGTLRSTPT